jgi:hypothetical protein
VRFIGQLRGAGRACQAALVFGKLRFVELVCGLLRDGRAALLSAPDRLSLSQPIKKWLKSSTPASLHNSCGDGTAKGLSGRIRSTSTAPANSSAIEQKWKHPASGKVHQVAERRGRDQPGDAETQVHHAAGSACIRRRDIHRNRPDGTDHKFRKEKCRRQRHSGHTQIPNQNDGIRNTNAPRKPAWITRTRAIRRRRRSHPRTELPRRWRES